MQHFCNSILIGKFKFYNLHNTKNTNTTNNNRRQLVEWLTVSDAMLFLQPWQSLHRQSCVQTSHNAWQTMTTVHYWSGWWSCDHFCTSAGRTHLYNNTWLHDLWLSSLKHRSNLLLKCVNTAGKLAWSTATNDSWVQHTNAIPDNWLKQNK